MIFVPTLQFLNFTTGLGYGIFIVSSKERAQKKNEKGNEKMKNTTTTTIARDAFLAYRDALASFTYADIIALARYFGISARKVHTFHGNGYRVVYFQRGSAVWEWDFYGYGIPADRFDVDYLEEA